MSADILIAVKNLSRYYGKLCAVDNISFAVQRGQIVGFLGPNGAGKSTTMQIITGALAPSHGQITVAGYDLLDNPLLAKQALGYLPEQPPLYQEMLVEEFLHFCAKLRRIPGNQVKKAVSRVIELCGLTSVHKRLIRNLSKGFQQRVGIAQAIIHTPMAVILDEPTVGLDPIQIREIRKLIRDLGQEHSVILSTHILPEVQAVCNHVQIIHQGKLVLSDTVEKLQMTTCLRVGLRHPPTIEALQQIAGVESVEILDNTHMRIFHASNNNPAEIIVEQSVAECWGLYELIPEQRSLEQIFVDLTCSDVIVEPQKPQIITEKTVTC